jgi:hypothetical protein
MSHSVEWVHRKVIRKWKEQPPVLSEQDVSLAQSRQRGKRRILILAGLTGLNPSYRPPTDPERGTHD